MKRVLKFLEKQSAPVSFEAIRIGTGCTDDEVRESLGEWIGRGRVKMSRITNEAGWRVDLGYRGDLVIGYEVVKQAQQA